MENNKERLNAIEKILSDLKNSSSNNDVDSQYALPKLKPDYSKPVLDICGVKYCSFVCDDSQENV